MFKHIGKKMVAVIAAVLLLSGCSYRLQEAAPSEGSPNTDVIQDSKADTGAPEVKEELPGDGTVNQGITVNKINFEIVDPSTLSEDMINEIDTLKLQRGYSYWPQEDGSYLIMISAGEKTTGGYSLEVVSIEDNEGKTNILVKESKSEGDMEIQVLTYPYVLVKASGITDQFNIKNLDQEEFQLILYDIA